MNWIQHVAAMLPHVVRIATPDVSGTGFILHINRQEKKLTIATASHVIRDAKTWGQIIEITHSTFKNPITARTQKREILLHPRFDSACLTVNLEDEFGIDTLPEVPIEHVPSQIAVPSGEEVGWLGFPALVTSDTPCFFSGHMSVYAERRYFIDGVAIPGVSGGPAFRYSLHDKKLQILGSVTAYSRSGQSLPGLMVADDCTYWPNFFRDNA